MGALTGPLAVTGASGFIGRRVVAAARHRGIAVRAMTRGEGLKSWRGDDGITVTRLDLGDGDSRPALRDFLEGAGAVIHLAGALTGDARRQARDSEAATGALLAALAALGDGAPALIHVSSMAVYGSGGLAPGDLLDETAPLETDPRGRDAYCRARLAMERGVLAHADDTGRPATILRPGAVYGPGRLVNGHLGMALGNGLLTIAPEGRMPVIFVDHCAEALLRFALAPAPETTVCNLLDSDVPTRADYVAALMAAGWPRWQRSVSWARAESLARAVAALPLIGARAPGLLRPASLRARLMPLDYSNRLMVARLGWTPPLGFKEAMARSLPAAARGAAHG